MLRRNVSQLHTFVKTVNIGSIKAKDLSRVDGSKRLMSIIASRSFQPVSIRSFGPTQLLNQPHPINSSKSNSQRTIQLQSFSTKPSSGKDDDNISSGSDEAKSSSMRKVDYDEYDEYEEPRTAGQYVRRHHSQQPLFYDHYWHHILPTKYFYTINIGCILHKSAASISVDWIRHVLYLSNSKRIVPRTFEPQQLVLRSLRFTTVQWSSESD